MIAKAVTLHTVRNGSQYWLGEITYTSTGMLAGVTEYGNFAFAWRAFGGDFEKFLLSIEPDYLEGKLEGEFIRLHVAKTAARKQARLIATMILRNLQAHLVTERAKAGEP